MIGCKVEGSRVRLTSDAPLAMPEVPRVEELSEKVPLLEADRILLIGLCQNDILTESFQRFDEQSFTMVVLN